MKRKCKRVIRSLVTIALAVPLIFSTVPHDGFVTVAKAAAYTFSTVSNLQVGNYEGSIGTDQVLKVGDTFTVPSGQSGDNVSVELDGTTVGNISQGFTFTVIKSGDNLVIKNDKNDKTKIYEYENNENFHSLDTLVVDKVEFFNSSYNIYISRNKTYNNSVNFFYLYHVLFCGDSVNGAVITEKRFVNTRYAIKLAVPSVSEGKIFCPFINGKPNPSSVQDGICALTGDASDTVDFKEITLLTSDNPVTSWSGMMVAQAEFDEDAEEYGEININGAVTLTGDTELLLCDNAKVTINGTTAGNSPLINGSEYSLNITGQSDDEDAGELIVNGNSGYHQNGFCVKSYKQSGGKVTTKDVLEIGIDCNLFSMTGGVLDVSSNRNYGIKCNENILVEGGMLTAGTSSTDVLTAAVYAQRYVQLLGGKITVNGVVRAGITNVLKWSNSRDSIKASSYIGSVSFRKSFINENDELAYYSSEEDNNINGQTLTPASSYTATFVIGKDGSGNDIVYKTVRAKVGTDKVTKPADPTKENAYFGDWYTDENCSDEKLFNFNTALNQDITLYAKWVKVPITPVVIIKSWIQGTYDVTKNTPVVSADSNPGSGAVTYEYFTDADCMTKTTASNSGAATEGGVPVNIGTYYVKANVAETTYYQSGTGTASFVIVDPTVAVGPDATVENNTDQIELNQGVVQKNNGTVMTNNGEVTHNYSGRDYADISEAGTLYFQNRYYYGEDNGKGVRTNNGTITVNEPGGYVKKNSVIGLIDVNDNANPDVTDGGRRIARVEDNYGKINANKGYTWNNYGIIATNYYGITYSGSLYNGGVYYNRPGAVVENNKGTVRWNYSTVQINSGSGYIDCNDGASKVITNYGHVDGNSATVVTNARSATEGTGKVRENYGLLESNHGVVKFNYPGVYTEDSDYSNPESMKKGIRINESDGEIESNQGAVCINKGGIITNTNYGTVQKVIGADAEHKALVTTNNGMINAVDLYGVVKNNNVGTIENLRGGLVESNYGNVTIDSTAGGTVENQYSGQVKGGGTITNYYGGDVSLFTGTIINNFTDVDETTPLVIKNAVNQYRSVNFVADVHSTVTYGAEFTEKNVKVRNSGNNREFIDRVVKYVKLSGEGDIEATLTLTPATSYQINEKEGFIASGTAIAAESGVTFSYTAFKNDNGSYTLSLSNISNSLQNINVGTFGLEVIVKENSGGTGGVYSGGGSGSSGGSGASGGSGSSDDKKTDESEKDKTPSSNADKPKTNVSSDASKDNKPSADAKEPIKDVKTVTSSDGTVTVTEKVTSSDGTVSVKETVTSSDGTKVEKEIVTAVDGTKVEKEITTAVDGTKTEKETKTDAVGNKITSTEVINKDGSTEKTTEKVNVDGSTEKTIEKVKVDGSKEKVRDVVKADGTKIHEEKTIKSSGDYTFAKETISNGKHTIATEDKSGKTKVVANYSVTSGKKVALNKVTNNAKSGMVTIPKAVKSNGKTYTVTVLKKGMLKGGVTKPKTVSMSAKGITKIEKGAFNNLAKKGTIKVSGTKKEFKKLKKMLKKSGLPKGVKLKRVK